jgi:hypothetical protein
VIIDDFQRSLIFEPLNCAACRRSHTTASGVQVFDELTAVGIDTVECDLVVGAAFSEPEKLNCHNVI